MVLDPVSTVSLLGQTVSVLRAVGNYVHDIRHCPEIITRIQGQVSTWHLQLESLRLFQEHGELEGTMKAVLQSKDVLGEAYDCLTRLKKLLDKAPRPQQQSSVSFQELWKRATWPPTSTDNANELLQRLDIQRRAIQLALETSNS